MEKRRAAAFQLAVLCAASFCLGACATAPYRHPLAESMRAEVGQATVYVQLADPGLGVELYEQVSTGVGQQAGGLVGLLVAAAVDHAVNAKPIAVAESSAERIAPTVDVSALRARFAADVQERLQKAELFPRPLRVRELEQHQDMKIASFSEQAVLALKVNCSLTQDLRTVRVSADAFLLSRSAGVEDKQGILYRNRFEYLSGPVALEPAVSTASDAATESAPSDAWVADGGVKLGAEITAGTEAIVEMLIQDLLDPSPNPGSAPASTPEGNRVLVRVARGPYAGEIISQPRGFVAPEFNRVAYAKSPQIAVPAK